MPQPVLTPFEMAYLAEVVDRYCESRGFTDGKARASLASSALSYYQQGAVTEDELVELLDVAMIISRYNEI